MNPNDLDPFDPETGLVRVVIDTPTGSRNKYKFDSNANLFQVSRVLPSGMAFPDNFGSIPGTCAEDGDPLDMLVLGLAPAFPGCLATARTLGVLRATQRERGKWIRNDRLVGIAVTAVNRPRATDLRSVDPVHLKDIERFFEAYNRAQGREFRITGRGNARAAEATVRRAVQRFNRAEEH